MSRTFDISINEPVETVLLRVRDAVIDSGGAFDGDILRGSFSGSGVEGGYEVLGHVIRVSLLKKPWVVSWNYVEGEIRDFFKS